MKDGTKSALGIIEGTAPDADESESWTDDEIDGFYRGVYDSEICPVRHILKGIADKWTILILAGLKSDRQRFSGLQRLVPDVSQRILTQTLRKLERDGYILRQVTPSIPPRVDYELTPLGQSLVTQLVPLTRWAAAHREAINAARRSYDAAHDI